jgi:biotin transport system substrate-specific component
MSTVAVPAPRTLADLIPVGSTRARAIARDTALVLTGAVLVGLAAQVAIPLPFTPVPLTLQTAAVLLTVAALGSKRGLWSMGLYLIAGVAGVPWFSGAHSGFAFASFGYIVGFLIAAVLVGRLAEAGADRKVHTTVALMILGNLAIYAAGVPGLMIFTGMDLGTALAKGVLPFLIGDAIKIAAAAAVLPLAWKAVRR